MEVESDDDDERENRNDGPHAPDQDTQVQDMDEVRTNEVTLLVHASSIQEHLVLDVTSLSFGAFTSHTLSRSGI